MSGEDFEHLAALWRAEPSAEEQQVLEALARRTSWRARATGYVEVGGSILLLVVLGFIILTAAAPVAAVSGLTLVVAVVWSTWKSHQLHQIALIVDTSDREVLLETAFMGAQARLRKARMAIWLLLPGYVLATSTAFTYLSGSLNGFLSVLIGQTLPLSSRGLVGFILLCAAMGYFVHRYRSAKREADNLARLRLGYRKEAELDAIASSRPPN